MRKLLLTLALAATALLGHAQEVIVMDKAMFIDKVFDYENSKEWKYKGDKPAIIDLYADWCGPCRKVAPIMKELAKEYAGKITIYKVNVDKEQELAALFNATSMKNHHLQGERGQGAGARRPVQRHQHSPLCTHPPEGAAAADARRRRQGHVQEGYRRVPLEEMIDAWH